MTEPTEPTKPTEPTEKPGPATTDDGIRPVRRFRRVRALLAPAGSVLSKIPHPPLRSKRGIFVLFMLVLGSGAAAGVGGIMSVEFSETAGFCGLCHTMDPELKAYELSPHREVPCAECHVEPGLGGFVKAKANGTKQLVGILSGKYPTPIPPPDHGHMPKVKDTCLKCHEMDKLLDNGGPTKLIVKPRYRLDVGNTREEVAIMIRPNGLGEAGGIRGVHWHVDEEVSYVSSDELGRKIELVSFKSKDGTTKQYISGKEIGLSTDVKPDIARLSKEKTRRMDCMDCHNRVGHPVPSPEKAVDEAIDDGRISKALPFIKRDGVALLNGDYASDEDADKAINGLRANYAARYPLVAKKQGEQITEAIDELKVVYRLIATPAMKVQAKTYPDNIGHQSSPGCFRCHDGAHYRVVKGKITSEKIPSTCATCHTFPQVGKSVATPIGAKADRAPRADAPVSFPLAESAVEFALGNKPADHKDKLYVFSHKKATSKTNPTASSCGTCHTRTYCENCHTSGAVKVKHNSMLYSHAKSITASGGTQSCAYCHQPPSCERCHDEPVLQARALPAARKGRLAP